VPGSPSQRKKQKAAVKQRPEQAAVSSAASGPRPVGARFPHGAAAQGVAPAAPGKGPARTSIYGGNPSGNPVGARFHAQDPAKSARAQGGRWRLRNWRLRSRLVILLVIPLVLAGVLGGLRISASVGEIQELAAVQDEVALTQQVATVIDALQIERHLTAAAAATQAVEQRALVEEQVQQVDAEVAALLELEDDKANLTETSGSAYGDALFRLGTLGSIRERVAVPGTAVDVAISRYSEILAALLRFNRTALAGTSAVSGDLGRGISFMAEAKEQLSVQHAVLLAASLSNLMTSVQQSQLRSTEAAFDAAIRNFAESVPSAQRQIYFSTFRGAAIADRERLLLIGLGEWPTFVPLDSIPSNWNDTSSAVSDMLLTVESSLSSDLLTASEQASAAAVTDTIRDASIVALLLLFTLILLVLVARSVLRPLLALRTSALDVAQRRLPALVEQLRQPGGWKADVAPEPMAVHTGEDIGQVARAFDEVHREAVRLATEQAMMRSTVNDMFVNLSRRSQSMVERQLRIIDALESGERDPEALGELFRLDHLATRMRRNNENLLVLAGSETRQRAGGSRPVLDILRGAISEIEDYQRITIESVPDLAVRGPAVNDLVHLTAELLDNATNFSPKEAQVVLASSLQPDGSLLVEIRDTGVGMSPAQRNAINNRLAVPPMVDVSVSRHMGLFVVGRLAARHGISVRMVAAGSERGLTAAVSVPRALIPAEAEGPGQATGVVAAASNGAVASAENGSVVDAAPKGAPVPATSGSMFGPVRNGSLVPTAPGAASNGTTSGSLFDAAVTQALDLKPAALAASNGSGLNLFAPNVSPDEQSTDFFAALPAADSSSQGQGEGTPIFQEMRSAWFRQGPSLSGFPDAGEGSGDGDYPVESARAAPSWDIEASTPDFGSVADEGWQAAEQLLTPVDAGTTHAGLPRRRPRAHLVPGGAARSGVETLASFDGRTNTAVRTNNVTLLRDAERVRGNLSNYQRGTRRGRHSSPMEDSERSVGDQMREGVGRHGELPTSQERQ